MNENLFEVDFAEYCPKCKHYGDAEVKDPCNECSAVGMREFTRKPEYFEEAV